MVRSNLGQLFTHISESNRRISRWCRTILFCSQSTENYYRDRATIRVPGLAPFDGDPDWEFLDSAGDGDEPDREPVSHAALEQTWFNAWRWVHLASRQYWLSVVRQLIASAWHVHGEYLQGWCLRSITDPRISRGLHNFAWYNPRQHDAERTRSSRPAASRGGARGSMEAGRRGRGGGASSSSSSTGTSRRR